MWKLTYWCMIRACRLDATSKDCLHCWHCGVWWCHDVVRNTDRWRQYRQGVQQGSVCAGTMKHVYYSLWFKVVGGMATCRIASAMEQREHFIDCYFPQVPSFQERSTKYIIFTKQNLLSEGAATHLNECYYLRRSLDISARVIFWSHINEVNMSSTHTPEGLQTVDQEQLPLPCMVHWRRCGGRDLYQAAAKTISSLGQHTVDGRNPAMGCKKPCKMTG